MHNSPPAFGSWLKARRKALDLTQAELAQRIGYSARTLEKLEAGLRRPSREIVPLLAAALGVPDGEREAFAEFARAIEAHAGGWGDGAAPWRTRSLPPTPNNLPAERAGFVGRESILASLSSLLARPEVRLVTLTGPPGVGKTRLSLRLAAQALATFEDGVFFVPLDRVRDPLMVLPAIAQAISAREPTGGRQLLEQLASYLKDKTTLLVLDNFEQVLSAAPPLGDLLSRLPQLKLLVTSRELLNLYGEHNFPVPPLSLPTNDELLTPHSSLLSDYEAVRLFVERATAARPDFTLDDTNARDVAAICVSLDGLPLAIELAAAHIRTMPPRAIAERLGQRLRLLVGGPQDLPSRQQALSAALDWSYDLLDSDERDLFRRLSVFSGGGTLAAIEIVCGPLVPDLLDSLTGKSLLRHEIHNDEPRYSMLETVREYAWEMLVESGEAEEVLGRHAAFFVALADEAFDALSGPDQAAWLRRLEPEHGNLRVALTTLLEREDGEAALRLGVGVWRYWTMHGFNSEGMNWLTRALEIGGDAPLELQGLAYNAAGNLAWSNGALDTAWRLHQQGLGIRRQTGDKLRVASSLNNLGLVAQDRGDFEQARALLEESLQICRALDDKADIAS